MDEIARRISKVDWMDDQSRSETRDYVASEFQKPLVSVLISNYNYADYIVRCVGSVMDQTYELIECIIVDDASTDASGAKLDEIQTRYKNVIVVRRLKNGGQSAAALDGLSRASGKYVVFLDADDALLPTAIASHVYAHVSLRLPVGFTCADMLQLSDDTLISASCLPFNRFILDNPESKFQPRQATQEAIERPAAVPANILERIYLVNPWDDGWAWSATSAMMFRRDALAFWEFTPGLENLRYSTDAFFCYGVNALCGSALIDMPLAAYRIHGRNGFASRLPLNNVRTFNFNSQGEQSSQALRLLLKQARQNRTFYRGLFWSEAQYGRMMKGFKAKILHLTELNKEAPNSVLLIRAAEAMFSRVLSAIRTAFNRTSREV